VQLSDPALGTPRLQPVREAEFTDSPGPIRIALNAMYSRGRSGESYLTICRRVNIGYDAPHHLIVQPAP